MILALRPMTLADARVVLGWRYAGDYAMYNAGSADIEGDAAEMADPENHYRTIYEGEVLIGHAVCHAEARVPGGDYTAEALDIGLGLRPDYTGRGYGSSVIAATMDFYRKQVQPKAFRATIAAWNIRAQRAIIKNGFVEASRFSATSTGLEFIIFMRPA